MVTQFADHHKQNVLVEGPRTAWESTVLVLSPSSRAKELYCGWATTGAAISRATGSKPALAYQLKSTIEMR